MLTHEPRAFLCFDKSSIIRKLNGAAEDRAPRVTQSGTEALGQRGEAAVLRGGGSDHLPRLHHSPGTANSSIGR